MQNAWINSTGKTGYLIKQKDKGRKLRYVGERTVKKARRNAVVLKRPGKSLGKVTTKVVWTKKGRKIKKKKFCFWRSRGSWTNWKSASGGTTRGGPVVLGGGVLLVSRQAGRRKSKKLRGEETPHENQLGCADKFATKKSRATEITEIWTR